jgi:hypothetical protein
MLAGSNLFEELLGFVRDFAGGENGTVDTLAGQASTRRYHRVSTQGRPSSCVVMELPEDDRKLGEEALPFLNLHRYLSRASYPVPQVYRTAMAAGFIALEDLGDRTFEQAVKSARSPRERRGLYRHAIDLIAELQRVGAAHPDPSCLAFGRSFDYKLLRWELDHFKEWLLGADRGVVLDPAEDRVVSAAFDDLARELSLAPPVLVHRDFQSRNLMVVGGGRGRGRGRIRVIDFQDALLGPRVYDLVALLRDSYVELPAAEVGEYLEYFAEISTKNSVISITEQFYKQTVQRKLKDAGRFIFIDRVRGNPGFLPSVAPSLRYVRDALLRVPGLAPLHEILARHVHELA